MFCHIFVTSSSSPPFRNKWYSSLRCYSNKIFCSIMRFVWRVCFGSRSCCEGSQGLSVTFPAHTIQAGSFYCSYPPISALFISWKFVQADTFIFPSPWSTIYSTTTIYHVVKLEKKNHFDNNGGQLWKPTARLVLAPPTLDRDVTSKASIESIHAGRGLVSKTRLTAVKKTPAMAASTKRPAKTSTRHCSVPFSTNNDHKDVERKLSFFTFPADTDIRKQWIWKLGLTKGLSSRYFQTNWDFTNSLFAVFLHTQVEYWRFMHIHDSGFEVEQFWW